MSIDEWDRDIAPRLNRIETYSTYLASDASTIARNASELSKMPAFETKAGDQLHCAKRELEAALAQVNAAITKVSSTPIAA